MGVFLTYVVILYRNATVGARLAKCPSDVLFSFMESRRLMPPRECPKTYFGLDLFRKMHFLCLPPHINLEFMPLISHHAARTAIDVFCQPLPRSLIVTNHHRHIRWSRLGLVAEALLGYFSAHPVVLVFLSRCSLLEFPNDNYSSCSSAAQLHRRRFHRSKNVETLCRSTCPSRSRRLL
jgi:hypothetical protein